MGNKSSKLKVVITNDGMSRNTLIKRWQKEFPTMILKKVY
jgi:hypothetical protein